MCYVFRDTDVRFSQKEGGIWLHGKDETRFLMLKDCVSKAHPQEGKPHISVGTRDVTKLMFTFYSKPPVSIVFVKGILSYIRTGKTAAERFHQLQKDLNSLGYQTYDLS